LFFVTHFDKCEERGFKKRKTSSKIKRNNILSAEMRSIAKTRLCLSCAKPKRGRGELYARFMSSVLNILWVVYGASIHSN
jgi:hypothetical protein